MKKLFTFPLLVLAFMSVFASNSGIKIDSLGGCTNIEAINYDDSATFDDGSCEYDNDTTIVVDLEGCTDIDAINYDELATFDDGTCDYGNNDNIIVKGFVYGCIDMNAENYDELATVDNGSCTYTEDYLNTNPAITGCTDSEALTYNPDATISNNNSCIYSQDTVNSKLTIDIEQITDTVTTAKDNCELDYTKLIDSASVKSIVENNVVWSVWQRGEELEIPANYDDLPSTGTLMYLQINCVSPNARVTSSTSSRTVRDVVQVEVVTSNTDAISNNVIVYPNPVSGDLININGDNIDYVSIINSQGSKVIVSQVSENNTVDISNLSNGMYFISIHLTDGSVVYETITKY
jgi:hypothetical protein